MTTTIFSSLTFNLPQLTPYFICFLLLLLLIEQISYLKKKRYVPGPALVIPFIGNAISLICKPTKFWDVQAAPAKSCSLGFSVNYIIGNFIVFIRDTEFSHKVFANCAPMPTIWWVTPSATANLIYMMGQDHKDLRRPIAPNFTLKALSTYIALQQIIILRRLKKWDQISSEDAPNPIPLRVPARDMNLETSQTVFLGPYLSLKAA